MHCQWRESYYYRGDCSSTSCDVSDASWGPAAVSPLATRPASPRVPGPDAVSSCQPPRRLATRPASHRVPPPSRHSACLAQGPAAVSPLGRPCPGSRHSACLALGPATVSPLGRPHPGSRRRLDSKETRCIAIPCAPTSAASAPPYPHKPLSETESETVFP